MSGPPLEELLSIVRRDLGAEDARILEADETPPPSPGSLSCDLNGGRRLLVTFAEPPADADARRRRLAMLVSSFPSLLTPPDKPRASRPPPALSLHDELAALVQRADAVDAAVIDAHSPVVWGTAGEEREAPSFAPGSTPPTDRLRETGALRLLKAAEETEVRRLSQLYGLAPIEGSWMDARAVHLVPRALCEKYGLVPFAMNTETRTLVMGMVDPRNVDAIHDLVLVTGFQVEPVVAAESMLAILSRWNDELVDTRSYEEVMAAIAPQDRARREEAARDARDEWARHLASRRAIFEVRELPEMETLPRGGHLHHMVSEPDFGYVARSFAGIYVLVLVFDAAFDELRAKRAIVHALPAIERLVLALPPLDPGPPVAGVVALRGRRQGRRR